MQTSKVLSVALLSFLALSVRAEKRLLSSWEFSHDKKSWTKVTVPHDWAISGEFDPFYDRQVVRIIQDGEKEATKKEGRTGGLPWVGKGYYRTVVEIPKDAKFASLVFDGVMAEPQVFCDGKKVGEWKYGYGSFEVELLAEAGSHLIELELLNRPQSSRWYPGSGIYREVEFITGGEIGIENWGVIIHTPTKDELVVKTECRGKPFKTVHTILDGMKEIGKFEGERFKGDFELWSPENPKLYTLKTEVFDKDLKLCDTSINRFGVRTIKYSKDGFFLNGKKRKFKGVCLHHDLGALGAAFNRDAFRRQVAIMKEMGADSIRTSHNIPSKGQLEVCDEMGMMVMAEAFDSWAEPKCKNGYSLFFNEWWERDIANMVRKCRNHPSVVMWSIGNEIPEQIDSVKGPNLSMALQRKIRSLDPDPERKCTQGCDRMPAAIESGVNRVMEIPGVTYRLPYYKAMYDDTPAKIVLGAETASTISSRGEYFFPVIETNAWLRHGHSSSYDTEWCWWSNLPDDDFAMQDDNNWVIGQFVWTGFDYLGEPTPHPWPAHSSYFGIVDLAGIPKDRYYLYRSQWRKDSDTIHLLPHWTWPERMGKVVPVYCYTNGESGELFVNGKSQGIRKKDNSSRLDRYRLRWNDVVYEPGTIRVVVYDKKGAVIGEKSISTALDPDRIEIRKERFGNLLFAEISIVDSFGNLCPRAANKIKFRAGKDLVFKGVANGNPLCLENMTKPIMSAFNGKLTAIFEGSGTEIFVEMLK